MTASIHAVAVAAGDLGLLILGDSGSGKSALAARMMADWPFGRVRLVADDRVRLARHGDRVVARCHPAIEGRIELRGHGIADVAALEAAVLAGALRLGGAPPDRLPDRTPSIPVCGVDLPMAWLPAGPAAYERLVGLWPELRNEMLRVRSILTPAP